jgi:hypothetical protein
MKNIYNKGRYRNGEYAKHLRPFLKALGNRKWRRTAAVEIEQAFDEEIHTNPVKQQKRISRKKKKLIKVKAKEYWFRDLTRTYVRKYRTLRSAMDSLKRNNIIEGKIVN